MVYVLSNAVLNCSTPCDIDGVKILRSPGLHETDWVNVADRRYPDVDYGEGVSKDQMKYSMAAPARHYLECRKKYFLLITMAEEKRKGGCKAVRTTRINLTCNHSNGWKNGTRWYIYKFLVIVSA